MAWIGYKIGGRSLALLTGILIAVNTELISYSRMMLPKTIFSFLLSLIALASMYLISHRNNIQFFLTGVLLGLAALCRPVAISWGILLAAILLVQKKYRLRVRLNVVLALSIGYLLTMAPWLIRN